MTKPQMPAPSCIVAAMADQAAAAVLAHCRLDHDSFGLTGAAKMANERDELLIYHRIDDLMAAIATTQATSIKGAAAQVCQIPSLADALYDLVEEDDGKLRKARKIISTIELIAYSAVSVLRSIGVIEPDHALLAYCMSDKADPHARIAALVDRPQAA